MMSFFTFALTASVAMAGADDAMTYEACAMQVARAPEAALSAAEQWEGWGGGGEAQHCRAMAYLALDRPRAAARLLAGLAEQSVGRDAGTAARLFLQTAEAWMAGGDREPAYAALWKAYELTPDAPALHMGAATVYATGEHWEGVILSLRALERHAPLSADALVLRARSHWQRGERPEAARDLEAALQIDPTLVDGLVLRGRLLSAGVAFANDPLDQR